MKAQLLHKPLLAVCLLIMAMVPQCSRAQQDSTPATPIVRLHYYNVNNSMQYVILESMQKKGRVFTPQPNKKYQLYLDSSSAANLVAVATTGADGKAKAFIPVGLKAKWESAGAHTFIVSENDEEIINDYTITKTRMMIDTSSEDSTKSITLTLEKMEGGEWKPAPDVECKLGVKRLGGILSAGTEESYTTDSAGKVTVEFTRKNLPGDLKGDILLVAKVEDNDELGSLLTEKKVAWGRASVMDTHFFDQRTLWSTRFKTPYWLLGMAYSIILGVWGGIIYLLFQIMKIKKLGKTKTGVV